MELQLRVTRERNLRAPEGSSVIEEGAVCCEGWEIDQVKRDNKVRFSWLLIQAQVQCFREES
jgi:ABC-type uncharacterized transport system ATPase subunit